MTSRNETPRRYRINRFPERARLDREQLDAVLDSGHRVGTLSTVVDGQPWVVPMLYVRDGDKLLLHGSTGSGALRHVVAGAPAALSVMHVDGWIFAHTMFNQSVSYRSALVHGSLVDLPPGEAAEALTQLVEVITPGRSTETPPHTRKHLAQTMMCSMEIEPGKWTVKYRDGEPTAPEPGEDFDPRLWSGMIPVHTVLGEPVPAARLAADPPPLSPSIARMIENYPSPGHGDH